MGMGDSSVATSGTKKKKKGFVKSLAKGFSIKKKKQRPDDDSVVGVALDRSNNNANGSNSAQANAAFAAAPPRNVGGANTYQPGGPPSSAATGRSSPAVSSIPKPIQVVLLLMDPTSRRFELLQLEFDSNKAMVSDVLRQIQCSATEKTLRDTSYHGVCDQFGMEMIASMKLSKFCNGNDVVMAMPKGMTGKDTAKLAGPILGDPKVEDMLAPCGVQVVKQAKKSRSTSGATKLTKIAEEDIRRKENKPPSPKKSKTTSRSIEKATKKEKKSSSSNLPTAILGICISVLLFFTIQRHVHVTRPIDSGDVLLPGQWKSQCGIFDLFPKEWLAKLPMDKLSSSCNTESSSMLELGSDGTLRYFAKGSDGERKEVWSVYGASGGIECSEGEDEVCYDEGATFVKDGSYWYVEMGGSRTSLNRDVIRDFISES